MNTHKSLLAFTATAVLLISLVMLATAGSADAGGPHGGQCNRLPSSNAEALEILSNYYPGYWWDHTDVTIAVQAHPNAAPEQLEAIDDAIATWSDVLERCFHGAITLTNVTQHNSSFRSAAQRGPRAV
jgi:hypothetical protein